MSLLYSFTQINTILYRSLFSWKYIFELETVPSILSQTFNTAATEAKLISLLKAPKRCNKTWCMHRILP